MDSSSGLLAMSGSLCAGMSDFTAMKTPPPPQSDRSFLNTVYSEGKHEYVGSSGLSFDSQPKKCQDLNCQCGWQRWQLAQSS